MWACCCCSCSCCFWGGILCLDGLKLAVWSNLKSRLTKPLPPLVWKENKTASHEYHIKFIFCVFLLLLLLLQMKRALYHFQWTFFRFFFFSIVFSLCFLCWCSAALSWLNYLIWIPVSLLFFFDFFSCWWRCDGNRAGLTPGLGSAAFKVGGTSHLRLLSKSQSCTNFGLSCGDVPFDNTEERKEGGKEGSRINEKSVPSHLPNVACRARRAKLQAIQARAFTHARRNASLQLLSRSIHSTV